MHVNNISTVQKTTITVTFESDEVDILVKLWNKASECLELATGPRRLNDSWVAGVEACFASTDEFERSIIDKMMGELAEWNGRK
jgi:hypothetical protein